MIILSHPTGNANVRAVSKGLVDTNQLVEFHTAIATFPGNLLDRISTINAFSEIRRRRLDSSLEPFTRLWPWRELGRLAALKAGVPSLTKHETGLFSIDAVYQNFDRHVASTLNRSVERGAKAVYAYEDGAAFSFREAHRLNMTCLYDLPIGYWRAARRLLEPEGERWPEWAITMPGLLDSETKLARKDEELQLADQIFVASQFTAKTLADFPGKLASITIIPYGFPPVAGERTYTVPNGQRRLKLLFVGSLSQRKGIANLFAAVESLEKYVDLTVIGHKVVDECVPLNKALSKHRWIPSLPNDKILQAMREHDVLIFPSLFEGFGLVITEAMSQGTPVITTDRTAGPDLIEHGQSGWLVEAGSTEKLVEAIENVLRQPQSIAAVGKAALESARQRPWSVYGQELAKAVTKSEIRFVK